MKLCDRSSYVQSPNTSEIFQIFSNPQPQYQHLKVKIFFLILLKYIKIVTHLMLEIEIAIQRYSGKSFARNISTVLQILSHPDR